MSQDRVDEGIVRILWEYMLKRDKKRCREELVALGEISDEAFQRLKESLGRARIGLVADRPKDLAIKDERLGEFIRILDEVFKARKDELAKPVFKARRAEPAKEEKPQEMSALEAQRFQRIFEACVKLGFKGEECFYVYWQMKKMYEAFIHRGITDAQEVLNSLPRAMFFQGSGDKWHIIMNHMIEFMEDTYLGVMPDRFTEFRAFFRDQYFRRRRQVSSPPLVTFPSSLPRKDLEFLQGELDQAFVHFYDRERKETWAFACLQRIFQRLDVDEPLKAAIRQEIKRLYLTHQILREAREPNVRDTDFLEFFDWFCINARPALDESRLGKLRGITRELEKLIDSWADPDIKKTARVRG